MKRDTEKVRRGSMLGEVAVDAQKYERQGEVDLWEDLVQELGKQATRMRTLDYMGK